MAALPPSRTSTPIEGESLQALHRGRGSFGGGAARQTTCYSCGGFGHMSRDCTQGQKCYNCKLNRIIEDIELILTFHY